jgi:serine/threonine-protein kinase
MRPQPGDLINGKYRLIRLIGDGGMGSVFEARHEYLGTVVALKFLHSELSSRPGLVARFLREARLSASIKSDHIARVTDVDQAGDGAAYLVMELLEGQSLRTLLDREGRLAPSVALDYTLQMLDGLEAAHAIGVVHRDLKPDNVFVVATPKGPLVKLLDFGIAKLRSSKELQGGLTRPGVMMGTPEYMAPEQAYAADSVDVRADVYSVGAILYEMLAGTRPAQGEDPLEIAAFIMAQKVPRLSQVDRTIPERLSEVVHRAMAPMPADRFTTVSELRAALTPLSGSQPPAMGTRAQGRGVPATLPPDAGEPVRTTHAGTGGRAAVRTTTQAGTDGPRGAHAATPHFTPPAYALPPPPPPAGPNPYLPGIPAPAGYANLPPVPGAPTKSPRRLSVWLLIAMSVLAIGVVAVALATGEFDMTSSTPTTTVATPAPAPPVAHPTATSTVATPTLPPVGTPVQPTAAPAPSPATKVPPKAHADGGLVAEDAATPVPGLPGFPFPIPSTLPSFSIPIPSTFPPFNLPGFPGAPAPAPTSSH